MQKIDRLLKVKELILNNKISKQRELLNLLIKSNIKITQATLSRDLKELNIASKFDSEYGDYIYFLPEDNSFEIDNTIVELTSVVSLEFSGNLGVLKTLPGFANSVAAIIDSINFNSIIGTVAGNDTILIILKDKVKTKDFIQEIGNKFPNILKILKP